MVKVGTCFEDNITDGENILYLIPKQELDNSNGSNGNNSNNNDSNGNGSSNSNNSKLPQSARKLLKLS